MEAKSKFSQAANEHCYTQGKTLFETSQTPKTSKKAAFDWIATTLDL